ncbi:MAG: phosphoribosylformylglycinamidine synthase [Flavobacteriaceae bacterium]|nr:phosphoribosylformylglycinamidine synthase [Flavobacteriaceae bacterium]
MVLFFKDKNELIYAVDSVEGLDSKNISKLEWLFVATYLKDCKVVPNKYLGPKKTMISPWSTNAVEITQNMAVNSLKRIEVFELLKSNSKKFDPMLFEIYSQLDQEIFKNSIIPDPLIEIENIASYNIKEGLALSKEEIIYLETLSKKIKRKLTDSEVFGFSQVNSEHCRHKIFNGKFIIDGKEKDLSLFKLIKKTSKLNPNEIVSAYKDNVAFVEGPNVEQFAPKNPEISSYFEKTNFKSVVSLKAETHNFPTTVEPFNGAATGSGGEIRDRLAGGKGSLPLAGTAVYMTSYPRIDNKRSWVNNARKWLYQTPLDILIKASNGASDFGNKFGQPLISGSVFTFEHNSNNLNLGYDKVIMLAGGIGFGKKDQSLKDIPNENDIIVVLGGDNYRIGMGGAAVSSTETGKYSSGIELNAVQRSNPEMQKRVANTIRAFVESKKNSIISIHDHGAGGHLNCLSELVEETGGVIDLDCLPIGDNTLSFKEIIGNESQERMGLIISEKNYSTLKKIADREKAPCYKVGKVKNDKNFIIHSGSLKKSPINLSLSDFFGNSPQTIMKDFKIKTNFSELNYQEHKLKEYLTNVLSLESVACKDWLTNKVDRCVTGKVAKQQCTGSLQLPLNNCGVMALDYLGMNGVATSIGHSPLVALIDPGAGSRNAVGKALTNIIWAPLEKSIKSVTLSANWMWPCNNPGEDARLYEAVEACSNFAIELGINIPTGKDSLSMKQKYKDKEVVSPGTVIISAAANCNDINKVIEPVFINNEDFIYYVDFSKMDYKLGGSAFAQTLGKIGSEASDIINGEYFKRVFNGLQDLIKKGMISSGHDISSGGLITTLLEMCFPENKIGAEIDLSFFNENDIIKLLFSENIGVVFQGNRRIEKELDSKKITFQKLGKVNNSGVLSIIKEKALYNFNIDKYRDIWYKTSYLLDLEQSGKIKAKERFDNFKKQPLKFKFPMNFNGKLKKVNNKRIKAAVIREKGSNSEREMAYAMSLVGFEVKDIHMTDLISGRENLENIQFIVAVGGFSNSDVLGSAKGWAGSFIYNNKAKNSLMNFYKRKDTLSLGVCNGCQLFIELGLLHPEHNKKPKMVHNDSNKFECIFTSVEIEKNNSVMFKNLSESKLGIWSAHGEGKFILPYNESKYNIVGKYGYEDYPANPNGSNYNTAIISNKDGRHIAMMPHLERSTFPWNWPYYPKNRNDEISPWVLAFQNAKTWLEKNS